MHSLRPLCLVLLCLPTLSWAAGDPSLPVWPSVADFPPAEVDLNPTWPVGSENPDAMQVENVEWEKPAVFDPACMNIDANQVDGQGNDWVKASGAVLLQQQDLQVGADSLLYDRRRNLLQAEGNLSLQRDKNNLQVEGSALSYDLTQQTGWLDNANYRLQGQRGFARGNAKSLRMVGKNQYQIDEGSYTACKISPPDWSIEAQRMNLNMQTNVGEVWNAKVRFLGVPILYVPWMDFALNGQRKSGLLTPTLSNSSQAGVTFALPYYWNIAPNLDATITPILLAKRGALLNNEFRYLLPAARGQIKAEGLYDYKLHTSRAGWNWQHVQNLSEGLSASVSLQGVLDDKHFVDLSNRLGVNSQVHLPREGQLNYQHALGRVNVLWQHLQTLQTDAAAVVQKPYWRAPQLNWELTPQRWGKSVFEFDGELTRFQHGENTAGTRTWVYPRISLPIVSRYGFVVPKLGWHVSNYRLQDVNHSNIQRNLPILSVDSGLLFERAARPFGDTPYVQTIEPRAYFVYIPYQDQSNIPNFDTDVRQFNALSIFQENAFTSVDKINNAHALTLALTSRWIAQDTGAERLRVTLAGRIHFNRSRVTLNSTLANSQNKLVPDILIEARGQISPSVSIESTVEFNQQNLIVTRGDVALHYQPEPGKSLNLASRYNQDGLHIQDISAQWPLTRQLYGMGRWQYSSHDKKTLDSLLGLEYQASCWSVRLLAQRTISTEQRYVNKIQLQLELNDLGRVGSNVLDVLKNTIFGYQSPATMQANQP